MGTFTSSEQLLETLGGFFRHLLQTPGIRESLLASKLVLRFNYKEPEASITVDLTGDLGVVTTNDTAKTPLVEMSMKADVAHRFWMGQVNLVVALARREIIAKGPIPKILKLLPIIKPAYQLYPAYIKDKGLFIEQ